MNKKDQRKQVFYNGIWIEKELFRTFVYNQKGQKLVNSWDEYQDALASGLWFETQECKPEEIKQPKKGKLKHANA